MRSQIFRTDPVTVAAPDTTVALKDVDGVDPLAVFVENVDVRARLRTRYGSKNANLEFVALAAGSGGNALEVQVDSVASFPASQAFAVSVVGSKVTVALRTDPSGVPNMVADEVAKRLNAVAGVAALMTVGRARGSDGSAVFGLVGDTDPAVPTFDSHLAGGSDAEDVTGVKVATSPTGAPDFAGPWVESNGPDVPAGTVVLVAVVDKPGRGLRVRAAPALYASKVVVSAIARRRGA